MCRSFRTGLDFIDLIYICTFRVLAIAQLKEVRKAKTRKRRCLFSLFSFSANKALAPITMIEKYYFKRKDIFLSLISVILRANCVHSNFT